MPSTVFFEYPPELRCKRDDISIIEPLKGRKLRFKSYWNRVCVNNAFKRAGFETTEKSSKWTALWYFLILFKSLHQIITYNKITTIKKKQSDNEISILTSQKINCFYYFFFSVKGQTSELF